MSLPLSDIVQVDIAVSPTLAPLAGFGELLFLTDETSVAGIIPKAERMRKFGSLKEVQETFKGINHVEAVQAAMAFYSQVPQPKDFTVGVQYTSATNAYLVGGEHATLETLKLVNAGSLKFHIGDVDKTVPTIDLSGSTSLEDVAAKVQVEVNKVTAKRSLANAKVYYHSGRFEIDFGSGNNQASFAIQTDTDGHLGYALGWTANRGGSLSEGGQPETAEQALAACQDVSNSFVAVATVKTMRDTDKVEKIATWCQASKKLFMNTTNDYRVQVPTQHEQTVAYKIQQKAFSKTITTYGVDDSEYPSVSLFARIATVNYEGANTCITLKFKKLPGITALKLTTSQKKAMDKLNVGGFMSYGDNLMYAESRMADGGWLDTVHGLMWLEDRIQKGVFNLMYGTTTKIPYTDTGINMLVQKVTGALEQARANGLVGAGHTPEGEFLANGYIIHAKSATEVSAEDKSNRLYRGITFKAIGAGALHNAIISGSFSE